MQTSRAGFTLLELLVTIAVIAILMAVILVGLNDSQAEARDVKRQADLRTVETALELYKQKYGAYPQGCNAAGSWSGQVGTSHACSSGAEYITGLAPEFISVLPRDPQQVSGDAGYAYLTNADGTVYKFMARNTVEADDIDYGHPFQSCPKTNSSVVVVSTDTARQDCPVPHSTGAANVAGCDIAVCDRLYTTSGAFNRTYQNAVRTPDGGDGNMAHCTDGNAAFESSYAVWGGLAEPDSNFYTYSGGNETVFDMLLDMSVERETEAVLCLVP